MPPYTPPEPEGQAGRRDLTRAAIVVFFAISLSLVGDGTQEFLAAQIRSSALLPFVSLQQGLANARVRAIRNEELQGQVDSLVSALTSRTTLEEENRRLRQLLGLSDRLGPAWTAAQVLRPGTQGSRSAFLLDVGSGDGVIARAPVLVRDGLAGMVTEVQEGVATGMDWTHPDFRASAMTEDGQVYGFIQAQPGRFAEEDRLLLTETEFTTDLEPGTVIVTSGLGGVLPRGIPIGEIVELTETEGRWRKNYLVDPYVEVGSLTHVLVGTDERVPDVDLTGAFGAARGGGVPAGGAR